MSLPSGDGRPARQPIFNIPTVVVALLAIMALVHLVRLNLLDEAQQIWMIANFAFFPSFPDGALPWGEVLPGARIWSSITYALLHADWGHLLLNGFWMAAFGSPLARRFGAVRFLAFSALAAIAGALVHLVAHGGEQVPLVGASAAISAHMAGAARFLFIAPPGMTRSYRTPAAPLSMVLRDQRTMVFLGAWLAINLIFGLSGGFGGETNIAWEAHIGGFAVGLLLFRVFDPVPTVPFLRQPPPPPRL